MKNIIVIVVAVVVAGVAYYLWAALAPDNADVQHAFGLALVCSGDYGAALAALARC